MDGTLVDADTLWPHNLTLVFYRLYNLLFGWKAWFFLFFFISFPIEKGSPMVLFMLCKHEFGLTSLHIFQKQERTHLESVPYFLTFLHYINNFYQYVLKF
jgi:hypothetical protein